VLLACYATTAVIHVASIVLNTLLPFHVTDLGGTRTQIGLLFSVMTVVSMVLRPTVGGWVDRYGVRPILVPGIVALGAASLALQAASTPAAVIALMVGLGLANGLISTPASVAAARESPPAHRGEALGTYYLASSLGIALGPPLAFGLRALGGMALALAFTTLMAALLGVLAARFAAAAGAGAPAAPAARGMRLWSRSAVPVSAALVLSTIGHSSVYAALAWFFTVYPLWLIACRVALRGVSDRLGHLPVSMAAMALVTAGHVVLVAPPTPLSLVLTAVVLGTGNSVLYPTLAALVVERAPDRERGLALGTLSGAWDLGIVVGSALIGAVADRFSYGAGFAVGALCSALGVLALALTARRPVARRVAAG
jgi:MFS family permease